MEENEQKKITLASGGKERKTRIKSRVWEFFLKLDDNYALCKVCNNKISYKTTVTNLKRHMLRQHEYVYKGRLTDSTDHELIVLETEHTEDSENATEDYILEIKNEITEKKPKRAKIAIIDSVGPTREFNPGHDEEDYPDEGTDFDRLETDGLRNNSLDKVPYADGVFQGRDEYSVFGELVAFRLRKIVGAKRRLELENRISQMLYFAEMDNYK